MTTHASMNRLYRLVWNETLGAFVPASELARARGKRGGGVLRKALCATLALSATSALVADPAPNTLPSGGQVVHGAAALSESAARLDITQSTDRVVIDWQRFDLGSDASVNFLQPSSSSIALNRVLSADPSAIYGRLTANGQVFLSNPNGVLFGSSARVDVGGLVATSMQTDTADFLAGRYQFSQGQGTVVNQGQLHAADGGYLALLAPEVRNEGVLSARLGTVALGAGQAATLQLAPGVPIALQVDPAAVDVLVENRHLIEAEGGHVILSASAAERLIGGSIPGTDGATGLVAENGSVRLVNAEGTIRASAISIDGGAVGVTRVAGVLDASDAAHGGNILVTGDKVLIDAGASLDASGRDGGNVLIGGDRQGLNPAVRNAARLFIDRDATVRADGGSGSDQSGDGGRVIAYSKDGTQVHGVLSARGGSTGGNGGFIETSGGWLDVTSVPDASAAAGPGGEWLIDPYNITIQAAGADTSVGSSPNWASTAASAILTTGSIQAALDAGTSVTVTTGAGGAEGGDIIVNDAITKSAGGNASFTLNAHRNILIYAPISSSSGALSLVFNSDLDNDVPGLILLGGNLTTLGGSINFMDGLAIAGNVAQTINSGGGNIDFNDQVLLANAAGVTLTTGGGNVTFNSLLDSSNSYAFVNSNLTWQAARTAAASGPGTSVGNTYLAVITSPLEMAIASAATNYTQAWLGGSDAAVEGTWRWVTGPEGLEDGGQGRSFFVGNRGGLGSTLIGYNGANGSYVNWSTGEPNDAGGNEDALQLSSGSGLWNDLPTSSGLLPYLRETNETPSPLSIDSGAGSITFNGNVGTNKALGALTLAGTGAINLNADIVNVSGTLTALGGGDVLLGAGNNPTLFADNGSVLVSRNIVKNAGADATLTLRADADVRLNLSADITASSNRLNVVLNSDYDSSGNGSVYLGPGTVITSNGGNVVLGGGTTPTTMPAMGANFTLRRGVYLNGGQIFSGAGNVIVNGGGGLNGGAGIDLVGATIESSSGSIELNGTGSAGVNSGSVGISVLNGSLVRSTAGGNVTLIGAATGSGELQAGINVQTNSTVAALNGGNLSLIGSGSASGIDAGSGWRNHGVYLQSSSSLLATGGGTITVAGIAGAGSSGIATLAGSNMIGNSSGYSGNIVLVSDTMALANLSVRSSGVLSVSPLDTATTIALGDGASGTLNLSAAELAAFVDGFSLLTFGLSNGTGDFDVRSYTFSDPLTLRSGAGDGDIRINGHLQNSGGSISLEAGDAIVVPSSGDITTQGGAITFNSDRDGSGAGGIGLSSGAAVTSNGGNITLRGGSAALAGVADPTAAAAAFATALNTTGARGAGSAGISLSGATLAAGGGNIELRGVGTSGNAGILIDGGTALTTTGTGTIALAGLGGTSGDGSDGIRITGAGSSAATQGGALYLLGLGRGGNSSRGIALDAFGSTLGSVGGNVVLFGASTATGNDASGIMVQNGSAVRTSGAGEIHMTGRGSGGGALGTGISIYNGAEVQTTGGGAIFLVGYGSATGSLFSNDGVRIDAALLEVQSGAAAGLNVIGYGGTGSNTNAGVTITNGSVVRVGATAVGQLAIGGAASGVSSNPGVLLDEDSIVESLGAAPILIVGVGSGSNSNGIEVANGSGNRIGSASMTGNITLQADTMSLQNLGAALSVRSSGNLLLQPYTANTSIGLGNGATGTLNLTVAELASFVDGFAQITIGRGDGTGAIDVETATFTDSLRLLNTGAGSGGIRLDGTIALGANRLWLSSLGVVSQGGALSTNELLLSGSGNIVLNNINNSIGIVAAAMSGPLVLQNTGSLTVGSITADGLTFNGISNAGGLVFIRTFGATSDLTLQQGISATGAGNTLQLIAGRNFFNNFGAAALNPGAGRWLVWSANPANGLRGGLAYDFKQYNASYGAAFVAQATGNGFIYSVAPSITASLTGQVSRAYDGTLAAALDSSNFSFTGAIDGDTIALTTPGSGTFDTRHVGTGKTVSASAIAIGSTMNGAATVYGYQLASANASAAIGEITPRTVTAGLTGTVSKEYDGSNAATLASGNYTLSGVLGGETVSLGTATSGSYDSANAGSGKQVSVGGLAISGADAANYALAATSISGNVGTITQRALTVTANDASQIYGDANPLFTASYSGFVAGENASVLGGTLSLGSAGTSLSDVGTYAITASGLASSNYALTYQLGTLTISPAALIVTADDLVKVYGSADPSLTYLVGGAGLRNGDILSGNLFAPSGAAATVGLHQIQQGTLTADGNYSLSFAPGTLSVTAAPLLVTAHDRIKTYGDVDPALTYTIGGSGLFYGDTLSGSLLAPLGAAATVGAHSISQGTLAANANYALSFAPGTLTVTAAPLLVTAHDHIKTYGDVDPALTYTTGGSGLFYGDTLSGDLLAPAGAAAGAGTHVISQGTLAANPNYALTFTPGTLTVQRAPLTITADNQARLLFRDNPPLTASASGWRYGEDFASIAGLILSTSATSAAPPGRYAIDASGATAANYAITYVPGTLEVLASSSVRNVPQGGDVLNNDRAAAPIAEFAAAAALPGDALIPQTSIRNGGIAVLQPKGQVTTTTMSGGFFAVEPLQALETDAGASLSFTLPGGTFRHSDAAASVIVDALSPDGSALPASLIYDASSRTLSGTLPAGEREVSIMFVAHDAMGSAATTTMPLRLRRRQ